MNTERLLKLADHLEIGQLSTSGFHFGFFRYKLSGCGTVGCALGECPAVFPDDWEFTSYDDDPVLRGKSSSFRSAQEFFDIEFKECIDLFSPAASEEIRPWNVIPLGDSATKEQVAQSIRNFVMWKESHMELTTRDEISAEYIKSL